MMFAIFGERTHSGPYCAKSSFLCPVSFYVRRADLYTAIIATELCFVAESAHVDKHPVAGPVGLEASCRIIVGNVNMTAQPHPPIIIITPPTLLRYSLGWCGNDGRTNFRRYIGLELPMAALHVCVIVLAPMLRFNDGNS